MKIKLTYTQFMCLFQLFKEIVLNDQSNIYMQDKLTHVIMLRIYEKLYKKAMKREPEYNLKLTAEEAMAFWLYWQLHTYPNASLEGNLLNQTIAKIDQQYA